MKPDQLDTGFWFNRRKSLEYRPGISKERHSLKTIMYVLREVQKVKDDKGLSTASLDEFKKFIERERADKKKRFEAELDRMPTAEEIGKEFLAAEMDAIEERFEEDQKRRESWYYG